MTTSDLRPILNRVAEHTLDITEARRQLLLQNSSFLYRLKSLITWVVLSCFLLTGLFLIRHAYRVTTSQRAIASQSRETSGTVVRLVPRTRKRTGNRLMAPVVTYQINGNQYSFESDIASSPPAYRIGDTVTVQYDPEQPEKATIKSFWSSWLPMLLFGGFGSLVTLISVIGVVALVRSKTRQIKFAPEMLHQRLDQVATGAISVDDAIRYLLPDQAVTTADTSSSRGWRLFLGAFLLVIIYFSLKQAGTSWRLLVHGQRTTGKVVALIRGTRGSAKAPVFRYSIDGVEYERVGATYSSPPAYEIGEIVTVVYESSSPAEGAIQSFSDQWGGPLFAVALAGFFLFVLLLPKPNQFGKRA